MRQPTDTEMQSAKEYLKQRLNAEESISRNLKSQLMIFAGKFLALLKKHNINPNVLVDPNWLSRTPFAFQYELQTLIRQFKDELYDDLETLCESANKDDKDYILATLNEKVYGFTLKSRINTWANKFTDQLKDVILKRSTDGVLPNTLPQSTILTLLTIGAGYGIERLLRQTISATYMTEWKKLNPQAQGFYSYRSSSYPCPTCDDMQGYHPLSDYPPYGDWHPNCVCLLVFIK